MGDTLEALHRLQKAELELHHLREQIESRRRRLRSLERRVGHLDQQIAAKQDQIRHLQSAADRAELEIRVHEEQIARLREALNKAKTNKEYAAILTQINTNKADTTKMEEAVLQQLAQIDAARKELDEIRQTWQRDQSRLQEETRAVELFERARDDDLARLQDEREQIAQSLPAQVLRIFERVAEKHDKQGMAVLEKPDPKREEYVCGGCHMSVPPDVKNLLHVRDELQHCGNCGRILYLDQDAVTKRRLRSP